MNVTQSAVSRQIATLEAYLRVRLFDRDHRGVVLTAEGEAYQRDILPAFALISSATQQIIGRQRIEPLRLRVYTSFAARWLIPRLPKFYSLYPAIEVRLDNVVAPVDFSRDDVDLAIQLGGGAWRGIEAELLFPDVIQPVCSPQLLQDTPVGSLEALKNHRLLHSRYRRTDWHDWLSAVGRLDLLADGMVFPSSVLTYQAALEGFGIAIGQIRLLEHDLASGALVTLFDRPVERDLAYYACWPANRPTTAKLRSFLGWVRREVAEQGKLLPPNTAKCAGGRDPVPAV